MTEHSAAAASNVPALEITGLHAWHNDVHVLRGVDLTIKVGQVAALVGHPGSGHDILLGAIVGGAPPHKGSVRIHGAETVHHAPDKIQHLGVAYCRAGTGISTGLSCEENLLLPSNTEDTLGGGMSLAEIYELIPHLYPRRHLPCTRLSGGEQQMLAIARILRTGANLLVLDNITDGLAPVMVQNLAELLERLRGLGYTLLLIGQNLDFSGPLADCVFVMHEGRAIETPPARTQSSAHDVCGAMHDN